MEDDYCNRREAETVDSRPIAFRIEINEEHRRCFIEHAKHCGLDKSNVAEDYLSTDDEEEHAPGDARNELKRAGSNFDGVELKPHRTKCEKFLEYYNVYDAENLIAFLPEEEFADMPREKTLPELILSVQQKREEEFEKEEAEKKRQRRERRRSRRSERENERFIQDEDVEMMDSENITEYQKYQEKQENQTAKDEDVEMRSGDSEETENSSAEDSEESDEPSGEEFEKMVDQYQKQMKRRKPILKEIFGRRAGGCDFTEEELRAAFAERKKHARDLRTFHWINPETDKFYLLPADRKSEQHFARFRKELQVCKQESKPGIFLSLPPSPEPESSPSSESDEDMEEIADDIFPL